MAYNFEGRNIIVTGAGRNIGRGIAVSLAQAGAQVYAIDCSRKGLDALVKDTPSVIPIQQDLENWEETKSVVNQIEQVDGLVNCAGILLFSENAVDVSKTNLDKSLNVNLLAPINLMQEVGKKMILAGKGGSIVNISSQATQLVGQRLLPYCVSKAGLNMATRQFAVELGPHKIRVNAISPGMVNTDMVTKSLPREAIEAKVAITPLRRMCEIEDCVKYVLFLLSNDSEMVSGTVTPVDGAFYSQAP